jgi:hypothetical protein
MAWNATVRAMVTGRTVAVIGAGSEMNDDDHSRRIRGVNTVVRVNPRACRAGIALSSVQRGHTTERIDLAYHAGTAMDDNVIGVRGTLAPLHPASSLEPETLAALAKSGCRAVLVPPHRCEGAQRRCACLRRVCPIVPYHGSYPEGHSCPTTGLGAIFDLLRLRPRVLYILGFDCYQGSTPYVVGHAESAMLEGSDPRDYVPPPGAERVGPHNFPKELASLYGMCVSNASTVRITPHLRNIFRAKGYDASSLQLAHPSAK